MVVTQAQWANLHLDRKFPCLTAIRQAIDRHCVDRGTALLTREHECQNPQWSRITREMVVG